MEEKNRLILRQEHLIFPKLKRTRCIINKGCSSVIMFNCHDTHPMEHIIITQRLR